MNENNQPQSQQQPSESVSETAKQAARLATDKFPYVDNPNNNLAVREWNQKMYDKREAFVDGYIAAWKTS